MAHALTSEEYTITLNEVKNLGSTTSMLRTEEQTQSTWFWADNARMETHPWTLAVDRRGGSGGLLAVDLSTLEFARLLVLLEIGLADATIVCWDASKYTFNHWRPIMGIHAALTDGTPGTDEDKFWLPLIDMPPFPAFILGNSTFTSTAALIIARVLDSNPISFDMILQGLPNGTRSFASFLDVAAKAGQSRIYGGIHWQYGYLDALAVSIQLGDLVLSITSLID